MKLAPLTLSFLLLAFITELPLAFSNNVEQVLDTSGNPLIPGDMYFIYAVTRNPPGGGQLRLGKTGNSTCPVTVLHDYSAVVSAVRFSIPGISPGAIFTGTPIDIEFTENPNCVGSSKWNVFVDNEIGKAYVGIGGPDDHPGKEIMSGTFRIQRSSPIYKLVFCVLRFPNCLDVGIYDNAEGGDRLILTDHEPLSYFFMRSPWNDVPSLNRNFIKQV